MHRFFVNVPYWNYSCLIGNIIKTLDINEIDHEKHNDDKSKE